MNKKYWITALLSLLIIISMSGCNTNYQTGYDDGYNAGYQDGVKALPDENTSVKVSGDFTATVRELIPDYVYDSETPRAAVVTLFQDGPFVLRLNEELCSKLEEGEAYTFIIDEQEADLPDNDFDDSGYVSWDALAVRRISVTDIRTPTEDEYGLECWRVSCTAE